MDVFPVFQVSQEIDGYLPTSPAILGQDSLPLGASGSLDSLIGGPVMTRSLIEQATDLSQLSPPLIPLPYDRLPRSIHPGWTWPFRLALPYDVIPG